MTEQPNLGHNPQKPQTSNTAWEGARNSDESKTMGWNL